MLVKNESKITEVQLKNGTVLRVGEDYEEGTIISIEAGKEFEKEIKDNLFEDWDGNKVSTSEVKLVLHITDGGEGWSVFMTENGDELVEL